MTTRAPGGSSKLASNTLQHRRQQSRKSLLMIRDRIDLPGSCELVHRASSGARRFRLQLWALSNRDKTKVSLLMRLAFFKLSRVKT
jgi:hypothetical protein